jgi:signal peptide peptidase SppA
MAEVNAQLAELDGRPVLYSPSFNNIAALLAAADVAKPAAVAAAHEQFLAGAKPYSMVNGVAMVPVTGVLLNRFPYAMSFATGYNAIHGMLSAALSDSDVKAIALDVNSNGGMVQGCFELVDFIYAAREQKPIYALVDANAHSAAYAIASAATKIIATRSASVGSIGVVAMHVDYSKALEKDGVKVTFVFAGDHKVDANPYEPLSKSVKAELQAEIDASYEDFVGLVARNRGIDAAAVRATEARTYGSAEALTLGLIDAVASPVDALSAVIGELRSSVSTTRRSVSMEKSEGASPQAVTEADVKAAAAAASATARADERARISAILSSDEAKERDTLARHLAFTTDMAADAAKGILAAAPAAAKAAVAPAFAAAMATGNPEVGADAGTAAVAADDVSKRILSAFSTATGRKFN